MALPANHQLAIPRIALVFGSNVGVERAPLASSPKKNYSFSSTTVFLER